MEAGKNIVFTGFMGAGKSEVAERVAHILGVELDDMDPIIEEAAGCTITEIIATRGERYFRKLESKVLRELLGYKGIVISAGGGTFVNPYTGEDNLEAAREKGVIVWLRVGFYAAANRVKKDKKKIQRPFFKDLVAARKLFNERQPLYKNAANIEVDVNHSIEGVVASVLWGVENY